MTSVTQRQVAYGIGYKWDLKNDTMNLFTKQKQTQRLGDDVIRLPKGKVCVEGRGGNRLGVWD